MWYEYDNQVMQKAATVLITYVERLAERLV